MAWRYTGLAPNQRFFKNHYQKILNFDTELAKDKVNSKKVHRIILDTADLAKKK